MKTVPFKLLGVLLFAFEGLIVCIFLNPIFWAHGSMDLRGLVRVCLFLVISTSVGVGLMYSRRWAAVILSLLSTGLAASLYYETYAFNYGMQFICVSITILFLIPMVATVKYWSVLKPGGKWYL